MRSLSCQKPRRPQASRETSEVDARVQFDHAHRCVKTPPFCYTTAHVISVLRTRQQQQPQSIPCTTQDNTLAIRIVHASDATAQLPLTTFPSCFPRQRRGCSCRAMRLWHKTWTGSSSRRPPFSMCMPHPCLVQENPPQKRGVVGCSSPFMRLTKHLTFRFELGASNVRLPGENPACSVPALYIRMRGPMAIRLRPCMVMSTPHHHPLVRGKSAPSSPQGVCCLITLVRGAVVNRTYGTHKNLYISLFLRATFGHIYYYGGP